MIKTALKVLIASGVSVVVVLSTDADAAGKRRGAAFSASPVIMKIESRRTAVRRTKVQRIKRFAGPRFARPRIVGQRIVRQRFVGQRIVRPRFVGPRIARPRYVAPRIVGPRIAAPRYVAPRIGTPGVPAQGAADKPSSADVMAGICNGAGGGASSHPDGTVHCTDPDGNDALPPVPAPD